MLQQYLKVEQLKICKCCNIAKPLTGFRICRSGNTRNQCNNCVSLIKRAWWKANKERRKKYAENYRERRRITNKLWVENNKDRARTNNRNYKKNRKQTDPLYKLAYNLRIRTSKLFNQKRFIKTTKFAEYIGCSIDELKLHLESKFTTEMTWENQGQWHVDHIIPLSLANTEEELYKLCHYTNLQPLWAIDNCRKGNRVNYEI